MKLLQIAYDFDITGTIDDTSLYQSFCRSFRYMGKRNKDSPEAEIGNSLHTDWNMLTLVWTDSIGFEVLYKGELYQLEQTGDQYLVCNCGDFLSSLSNG